ncbi:MAG: glucose 1-dehydrogenase [Motiliproteus sp.]
MRLIDKVALVTGGGSGIGEAVSHRFAEEGATVVVTDINFAGAQKVAESIVAAGGKAVALLQDVCSEDRWSEVVEQIIADYGRLDVLVNNAGIAIIGHVEELSLEQWRKTQTINGESVFLGTRSAISVMKQQGGSIINISSIEGIVGEAAAPAYNYSKGGVRIFSKSAALHCANEGYAIRVNSVHPGFIATPMVADVAKSMQSERAQKWQEHIMHHIPMNRLGEAVDIANACLFLASEESRYMTGTELIVDGGYTCH